ncbi:MAG TPA: hypothetical protein VGD58_19390 [Herpetosiphonaceae bacterium]
MMRWTPRRSPRPLLFVLALLLLAYAAWGLYRNYPDFSTLRSEPATLQLPAPSAGATP